MSFIRVSSVRVTVRPLPLTTKEKQQLSSCLKLLVGSPGPLVSGVDAGYGWYGEAARQGLGPAEVLQALTQLLTHAQHTKLHRLLTAIFIELYIANTVAPPKNNFFYSFLQGTAKRGSLPSFVLRRFRCFSRLGREWRFFLYY